MLLGGWRALRQYDIKVLLAYGTVSQLGFLIVLMGIGTRAAALGGLALLVSHALFKATLFLVVGIVDHTAGHPRPAQARPASGARCRWSPWPPRWPGRRWPRSRPRSGSPPRRRASRL